MHPVQWIGAAGGAVATGAALAAALGWAGPGAALPVAGGAAASVAALVGLASARPDLDVFGPSLRRTRHPGRLALTFDDGPDERSTGPLLEALVRAGATATFFLLGDRASRRPGLVRAIVEAGMEIGLHGREHSSRLTWLPPDRGAAWLAEGRAAIEAAGAPPIRWFRPPFGAVSPRLYRSVARAGLELVWCTVRTGDGGFATADQVRRACHQAVATDNVLLHEGGGVAVRLLPDLLLDWEGRGIRPTSVSAAMEAG